jgi:hypothetical protein
LKQFMDVHVSNGAWSGGERGCSASHGPGVEGREHRAIC